MNKREYVRANRLFAASHIGNTAQRDTYACCAFCCDLPVRVRTILLTLVIAALAVLAPVATGAGTAHAYMNEDKTTAVVADFDELKKAVEGSDGYGYVNQVVIDPQAAVDFAEKENAQVTYGDGAFYIPIEQPIRVSRDVTITTAEGIQVVFARSAKGGNGAHDSKAFSGANEEWPGFFNVISSRGKLTVEGNIVMSGDVVSSNFNEGSENKDPSFAFDVENHTWSRGNGTGVVDGGFFIHNAAGGEVVVNGAAASDEKATEDVVFADFVTDETVKNAAPVYVGGGSTFTMNGGSIMNNDVGYTEDGESNTAGGVMVKDNKTKAELLEGKIAGNRAFAGDILADEDATVTTGEGFVITANTSYEKKEAPEAEEKAAAEERAAAPEEKAAATEETTAPTEAPTVAPKRAMKGLMSTPSLRNGGGTPTEIKSSLALKKALEAGTSPIVLDTTLVKDGKYYFPIDEPLTVNKSVVIGTKDNKEIIITRSDKFEPTTDKPAIFNVVSGGNLTLNEKVTMTGDEVEKPVTAKMKLTTDGKFFGEKTVVNRQYLTVVNSESSGKEFSVIQSGHLVYGDANRTINYTFFIPSVGNPSDNYDFKLKALKSDTQLESNYSTTLDAGVSYVAEYITAQGVAKYIGFNSDKTDLALVDFANAIRFTAEPVVNEQTRPLKINKKTWNNTEVLPGGYFIHTKNGGKVTLNSGVTLTGLTTASDVKNAAPVYIDGAEFTMNGGSIEGNTIGYIGNSLDSTKLVKEIAGAIKGQDETGRANMTNTAGGIIFTNEATGTISGGSIKGNRADAGGILVTEDSFVTFSGGEINSNIGVHHAGAAQVEHGATLHMKGNAQMKHNIAWYKGGAVWATEWGTSGYAVADWTKWPNEFPTIKPGLAQRSSKGGGNFVMDGGTIEDNTAFARAGAIEVESNGVQLNGGSIINNKCRSLGGAIYIEGDSPGYSYTLALPRGYITNNEAIKHHASNGKNPTLNRQIGSSMDANGNWLVASNKDSYDGDFNGAMGNGGGIWLCPVGGTSVFTGGDTYIWNNESERSNANTKTFPNNGGSNGGEDFYLHKGNGSAMLQLQNMNGDWYNEQTGKKITDGVKSGPLSMRNTTDYTTGTNGVIISGNLARDGGAIACNGTFIIGQPKDVHRYNARLNLNKRWADGTVNEGRIVNLKLQYLYPTDADPDDENNWYDLKYMTAASEEKNYEVALNGQADQLGIEEAIGEIASTDDGRTWNAAAFIPLYIEHTDKTTNEVKQVPLYHLANPAPSNLTGDPARTESNYVDFSTVDVLDLTNEVHVGHLYHYIAQNGQLQEDGKTRKLDNLNISKWNLRVHETVKLNDQDITRTYRVETSAPEKDSVSVNADPITLLDPLDKTNVLSQFSITYTTSTFSQELTNELASIDVNLRKVADHNAGRPVAGARFLVVEAERDGSGDYRFAGVDGVFNLNKPHDKTYDKQGGETFSYDVKGLTDADKIVSDANGNFTVEKLLPNKTYFLFEYETPNAYHTHYAPWLIKVSEDGQQVNVYAIADGYKNWVKYCPQGGAGSYIDYTDKKVWHRYWPEGWYGLSAIASKNVISEPVQSHTLINDSVKIELTKTDDSSSPVTITDSASFALYESNRIPSELFNEDGTPKTENKDICVKKSDGKVAPAVATGTTQNGVLSMNVEKNKVYLLFETAAPQNYQRSKTPWLVWVKDDGTYRVFKYHANRVKNGSSDVAVSADDGWDALRNNLGSRWYPTTYDFTTKQNSTDKFNYTELTGAKANKLANTPMGLDFTKVDRANTNNELRNAKFDLYYANEVDSQMPGGNKKYVVNESKGKVNQDPIQIGADNKYHLPTSEAGIYLLYEREAEPGYTLPKAPWGVEITKDGKVTIYRLKYDKVDTYLQRNENKTQPAQLELECVEITDVPDRKIENERKPIEIIKAKGSIDGNGTLQYANPEVLIDGAVFKLYKAPKNQGKTKWLRGEQVGDAFTSENGILKLPVEASIRGVSTETGEGADPNGNYDYWLEEITPAPGYEKSKTPWILWVQNGKLMHLYRVKNYVTEGEITISGNYSIDFNEITSPQARIHNEPVKVYKTNEAGDAFLPDATFKVQGAYVGVNWIQKNLDTDNVWGTVTSSDGGVIDLSAIVSAHMGTKDKVVFFLTEQTPPPGYRSADKPWIVEVTRTGTVTVSVAGNLDKTENNFEYWSKQITTQDDVYLRNTANQSVFTKVDAATKQGLEGARFDLKYAKEVGGMYQIDTSQGTNGLYSTLESGEGGVVNIANLDPLVTYEFLLFETKAPTTEHRRELTPWYIKVSNGEIVEMKKFTTDDIFGYNESTTSWQTGEFKPVAGNQAENHKLYNLPKSGGMGTYWFMIIGAMMMAFVATMAIAGRTGLLVSMGITARKK